jgi:hypothetical protein
MQSVDSIQLGRYLSSIYHSEVFISEMHFLDSQNERTFTEKDNRAVLMQTFSSYN